MENVATSSELILDIEKVSTNEKVSTSVELELEILHPLSDKCCIYRVPNRLRHLNEKAYTPRIVSIGPIHHGKVELKAMEEHKRRYLQDFVQVSKVSVKEYVKVIQEKEARLRNCYAETIELSSEEFVKLILVDAAFIIMVLLIHSSIYPESSYDRIFDKPWMIADVTHDFYLLENQLPIFILDDLFKLSKVGNSGEGNSMIKLIHEFFKSKFNAWVTEEVLEQLESSDQVEHLVDFLRICQKPSKPLYKPKELKKLDIPSAMELHQAGVKFKKGSGTNLFDITFNEGIMEIPPLKVFDETEVLWRNLQVFEQCHSRSNFFNDYIALMNLLVNGPKDVELLIQKRIIENWASNTDRVATLFNNLATQNLIFYDRFYWSDLIENLNDYCSKPWPRWKATLKQDYFNNPWAIISFIAASSLLVLTFIQSVCSVLQVQENNKP